MPEKVNLDKSSSKKNIASLNSGNTSIEPKSAVQLNSTEHKLATLQKMADNSPYSQRYAHLTSLANNNIQKQPVSQLSKDSYSLPDNVKHGVESLSGISMDDVKVHYNSAKPAQLNAHAYAQGTDIHIASGQEKHLPHEAWHVVQQKQGRVQPTTMMKAKVPINDDAGLEKEADVMGARALQMKPFSLSDYKTEKSVQRKEIIQRNPLETIQKVDEEHDEELDFTGVTPASENEDVTDFFIDLWDMIDLDGWDLGPSAPSEDTSPEGSEGTDSSVDLWAMMAQDDWDLGSKAPSENTSPEGAEGTAKEASTQAVEKKEEEETITYIEQVYRYITNFLSKKTDVASAVAGNGVVSNASGTNTPDDILAELEENHGVKGSELYAYLSSQIPGIDKLKDLTKGDNFAVANRYIAVIAVLKDSAKLFSQIKELMAEKKGLSPEQKESVNEVILRDIKTTGADIFQGTAYGLEGGMRIAGAAGSAVPGLGIAGSAIEFLRGGWKGKKAMERRTRLLEVMQEINAIKDDHPGLAELKSKFNPIKERVNKRIAHNGLRSLGGAAAVVGGAIGIAAVVGTVGALTAATGGGFAIAAAVIGGVLALRMLNGQRRFKEESRQQLAEYLYETSLQDGGTGDSAKKIVKAIIGKEEYSGLRKEELIDLIAQKIKAT